MNGRKDNVIKLVLKKGILDESAGGVCIFCGKLD